MELIKSFKALSDKTRIRLLYLLNEYELNVNEIVRVIDMIQSGVSRHLKILVESDLLTFRRDASYIYYTAQKNDTAKTLISLMKKSDELKQVFDEDFKKAGEMIKIRKNRTRNFFKAVAPRWDRLKKEVFGDFDLNAIIKEKIETHGNIADLGCGTGELIELLLQKDSCSIVGVDSSPEMLKQARLKVSRGSETDLRLGELEHLPLKSREIDTAIMNMVLHHVSQPELPFSEVYRVLKEKGVFILTDFEKHDNKKIKKIMGGPWSGFKKEKIKIWLKDSRFSIVSIDSYEVNYNLTVNLFVSQKI